MIQIWVDMSRDIMDVLKNVGSKVFGKTTKEVAKKAATKAAETAATKTGEFAGKKAGDKIIQLSSREKQPKVSVVSSPIVNQLSEKELKNLKRMEMAERVNQLISGGKIRKRKNIYYNDIIQKSKVRRKVRRYIFRA